MCVNPSYLVSHIEQYIDFPVQHLRLLHPDAILHKDILDDQALHSVMR